MKIAMVIPLYTFGSKSDFNNYTPISLLPQLSKFLEKVKVCKDYLLDCGLAFSIVMKLGDSIVCYWTVSDRIGVHQL